jgi:hypothetical protein
MSSPMERLNAGWPFGDGPNQWPVRGEVRDGQVHLVCHGCGQSVFPLSLALDGPGYRVTGDLLKSRIADHCLKSHQDDLADAIRT